MNKGVIKITDALIKNDWHAIYPIFESFKPTHIEFRHWENDIWYYYGVSEFFDEIKEGESIPQYYIEIETSKSENRPFDFKFIRQ